MSIHCFLSLIQINYHVHKTLLFAVLFLFFYLFVFVSSCTTKGAGDYSGQWKKIDELVNKSLTKSALAEVGKIYSAAKNHKNDPQIIKSLLYWLPQKNIEENANVKSIATI